MSRDRAAPVHVGLLTLRFATPFARSLKEKRSLVRPVVERMRTRFPLSVARLEGLDAHDWERIGAVAVHADPVWLREVLESAYGFAVAQGVPVDEHRIEIDRWDPP